ncbi:MAG: hypothetical protein BWY87_01139 [Deltaproteobacteria bacterium ADurb.Bin510]|nr:MAG: hypothetical protein BWY87_01139 [Deltaproteobacteria bacterium ADurb.Bin510]
MVAARDALDQEGHVLLALVQAALQAIGQGVLAHGAGKDLAHGLAELLVALLGRALVDQKEAVVLAGKGVAEGVLEQAARAHDDRRLAEIVDHQHELLDDLVRKAAMQQALAQFAGRQKVALGGLVLHVELPEAVLHDVGVEDVRAYEVGVVGFEDVGRTQFRRSLDDLAGQQHADGLAAHEAGADQAVLELDEVGQAQEALGQLEDTLVAADDDPAELVQHGGALGRLAVVQQVFGLQEELVEEVQVAAGAFQARALDVVDEARGVTALGHGLEQFAFLIVREEHGGRVAVLDLERVYEAFAAIVVEVDQHLGGLVDARDGLVVVAVSDQAEVGHGVELEEVGAGDHEEVADHQVGGPGREQVGEAVKDVEGLAALDGGDGVDLLREEFEAAGGAQLAALDAFVLVQDGRVFGEAHVDQPAAVCEGAGGKGAREEPVVVHAVNLPDHVVAQMQAVQDLVEALEAGGNRIDLHAHPPRGPGAHLK